MQSCIKCKKDSIRSLCAECRILGSWYGQLRCDCGELAVECWTEILGCQRAYLVCKLHSDNMSHLREYYTVEKL